MYESIAIIAKRANQINISVERGAAQQTEEFASHTDSLEEIHENKEQIEISRAYERMPNGIAGYRSSWKIKSTIVRTKTICSANNQHLMV